MSDEYHMSLLSSWDDDFEVPKPKKAAPDANPSDDDTDLIRAFPEAFEPYRMAIRIAELEAQIARLTAPVTEEEAITSVYVLHRTRWVLTAPIDMKDMLTAFLERRMKG